MARLVCGRDGLIRQCRVGIEVSSLPFLSCLRQKCKGRKSRNLYLGVNKERRTYSRVGFPKHLWIIHNIQSILICMRVKKKERERQGWGSTFSSVCPSAHNSTVTTATWRVRVSWWTQPLSRSWENETEAKWHRRAAARPSTTTEHHLLQTLSCCLHRPHAQNLNPISSALLKITSSRLKENTPEMLELWSVLKKMSSSELKSYIWRWRKQCTEQLNGTCPHTFSLDLAQGLGVN